MVKGLYRRSQTLAVLLVVTALVATAFVFIAPRSDTGQTSDSALVAAEGLTAIWDHFQGPSAIAYGTPNDTLYVVNQWGNLSVINGTTNRFVEDLRTFSFPYSGVYDPEADELFVGTGSLPTPNAYGISVVDLKTARIVETIPGAIPWGTVYDPTTHAVYIESNGSILKLDAKTNAVDQTITGFGSFRPQAYDSVRNLLFGVNWTNILAVNLSTGRVAWNLSNSPVGVYPIGYDPLDGDVYVYGAGLNMAGVAVVDGATGKSVATIPDAIQPEGYLFDPANGDMYISDAGPRDQLVVANGTTNIEVAHIDVIAAPGGLAYDPVRQDVYVACTFPYVNMTGVVVVVPSIAYALPTQPVNLAAWTLVAVFVVVVAVAVVVLLERRRHPPSRLDPESEAPSTQPKRPR